MQCSISITKLSTKNTYIYRKNSIANVINYSIFKLQYFNVFI